MKVICNDKTMEIEERTTLSELLAMLNYRKTVAVFINGKQLLSSQLEGYRINEGDKIKIIRILGGG
ncbi:sulfur carrier protein ThiS [Gudongella sp. SC589]|uniref:sulfur carrier protein ThiS n=1 Tax=Gudongella sp. SC589 TaxID=3385990 RepID=UPI003904B252